MIAPHLPKKDLADNVKLTHAKYIFANSNKITPGWISAQLWINGIQVSKETIRNYSKILTGMLKEENGKG